MKQKKLVFIMGRSSSGKNTFAEILLEDKRFEELIMHTSRPKRTENEKGYKFHNTETFIKMKENGNFVETRSYNTNLGIWHYGTTKEDIFNALNKGKIPVITSGTPEMYFNIKSSLENLDIEILVCYLKVEDKELLTRAINREQCRLNPDYKEVCRRFLSDSVDYAEEITMKFPPNSTYTSTNTKENVKNFLHNNNL